MQSTLARACVHNCLCTLTHTNRGAQVGGPRWVKSLAQAVTKQQVQLCHTSNKIGHVRSWWSKQGWKPTESVCSRSTIFKSVCFALSHSYHIIIPCLWVHMSMSHQYHFISASISVSHLFVFPGASTCFFMLWISLLDFITLLKSEKNLRDEPNHWIKKHNEPHHAQRCRFYTKASDQDSLKDLIWKWKLHFRLLTKAVLMSPNRQRSK